ncbi:solute carrier family 15 member 2-like [Tropilaelaps mercedesae]|uniref:Solute carrier family 15 member 2-like n=1 Tax=Tropilaelaps mercedesae TaxID=418985 RepID=A0A1V9X942_9ACAR|nr:solute carrier family 15 member 2-like [Tropilaelaps mercedesae]
MVIYIPVPIFWALFDQQGSSWTLQATRMKWRVFNIPILPDQIQLLNPLCILVLAPLFGYVIYPMFKKCGILTKPLQKMFVGGVFAAASFLICMFLQFAVEAQDSNAVTLINTVPCTLNVTYTLNNALHTFQMAQNGDFLKVKRPYPDNIDIISTCESKALQYKPSKSYREPGEKAIIAREADLQIIDIPELGRGNVADVKVFVKEKMGSNLRLTDKDGNRFNLTELKQPGLQPIRCFRLELKAKDNQEYTLSGTNFTCRSQKLRVGEGYSYVASLNRCTMNITQAAPSISLIWQAPQYILITVGEVLFSVTGLEFSYSQAPKSMKSVLQAGWLMTVAIGNLLVVIVARFGLEKQSIEFLVFGLAMLVDMIFFAILVYFYKPTLRDSESPNPGNEMYDVAKEQRAAY